MNSQVAVIEQRSPSLITRVAERYGVEAGKMLDTLKATCFKADKPVSNEQMMALLIVAEQYHLNPFTKEIYAFPDKGGIVPVVGLDGWARIINEHPMLDGIDFDTDDPSAVTAIIHRKDRAHPIRVTEYMAECKRNTGPWNTHPRRMLRHKALIQAARLAFGFAGIYDEDEAHRIVHGEAQAEPPSAGAARVRAVLAGGTPTVVVDDTATPTEVLPPAPLDAPDADGVLWQLTDFAKAMEGIKAADTEEEAGLVLDLARGELTDDKYQMLVAAYHQKWQPQEGEA